METSHPKGGFIVKALSLRLTAAASALLFVAAACQPLPGGQDEPLADLELSYPGRGKVTLTCTPDGGSHPHPEAACDALRAVGGDFEKLVFTWKPGISCIDIYDPVYARATGSWQSSPEGPTFLVDYSKEFSNSCYASRYDNVVFRF